MCAIIGVINPLNKPISVDILNNIIHASSDRGRDGFGIVYGVYSKLQDTGIQKVFKTLDASDTYTGVTDTDIKYLLGNTRAEPTTEFIEHKTINDVQPYQYENTVIVHNGTIANDKDLKSKYDIICPTNIDSYVIAIEFDSIDISNIQDVKTCLTERLVGSYATLVKKDNYIIAATNYKPLYILNHEGVYYIASLPNYFGIDDTINSLASKILEIKPYTALHFNIDTGYIDTISLYKDVPEKKAVICASSGLDSTVAISWALNEGYEVTLLHFDYECRATVNERIAINNIAKYFKLPLYTVNADFFRKIIGGSNLYGEGVEINKNNEQGAELAIEWVPARNLIFLSIAAGFCEAKGINYLILGGNLEESGAYADNEYIFLKKFNDILPNALNLQHQVNILTPLANLMKRDIVKLGITLNAPLNLTWSCYDNGEKHCGHCGPCFMRRTAFKMLNQLEQIEYEH